MFRKSASVLLMVCILLTTILPVAHAEEWKPTDNDVLLKDEAFVLDEEQTTTEGNVLEQDCHTMTQQWFGDKPKTRYLGGTEDNVSEVLTDYFSVRENSYKEKSIVRGAITTMDMCSSVVQKEVEQRVAAIGNLEERADIDITACYYDRKWTANYKGLNRCGF